MRKVNIAEIAEQERRSPAGKYHKFVKDISIALGRESNSLDLVKRHPFDVAQVRIQPGKSYCPYHGHSAETEFYIVVAGRGFGILFQKLRARYQPRHDDIGFFYEDARFRFTLEAGNPWLDRPHSLHAAGLKELELIRVCRRHHGYIATRHRDIEALRLKPRTAGDVLRVSELRRGYLFSTKVRRFHDSTVGRNNQR